MTWSYKYRHFTLFLSENTSNSLYVFILKNISLFTIRVHFLVMGQLSTLKTKHSSPSLVLGVYLTYLDTHRPYHCSYFPVSSCPWIILFQYLLPVCLTSLFLIENFFTSSLKDLFYWKTGGTGFLVYNFYSYRLNYYKMVLTSNLIWCFL